jgi:hypothetical protein
MLRRAVPADQLEAMTASIPVRRLSTTAEVVGLVSSLLSDDSAFGTGSMHAMTGNNRHINVT